MLLAAVILAACAGGSSRTLAGRTFVVADGSEAGAPAPLVPGTQFRIRFETDGRVSAGAGCAGARGRWSIDGGVLRVDASTTSTNPDCSDVERAQDAWLLRLLGSSPIGTLNGMDLRLETGAMRVRLLDREVAEPDVPLVGPAWVLVAVRTRNLVIGYGETAATLTFGDDGSVDLSTGCNEGTARYDVAGTRLRFEAISLTKRACDGRSAEVESAVLTILEDAPAGFIVEARRLRLGSGDPQLWLDAR